MLIIVINVSGKFKYNTDFSSDIYIWVVYNKLFLRSGVYVCVCVCGCTHISDALKELYRAKHRINQEEKKKPFQATLLNVQGDYSLLSIYSTNIYWIPGTVLEQ